VHEPTTTAERVVLRDYPLWFWLPGVLTIAVSTEILQNTSERLLFWLLGVAVIAVAPILTVTVDHGRETLRLQYRYLLHVSNKTYPLSQIRFVNVAEDSEGERMYRLELVLRSGETVPLRNGYSVGKALKERRAQRLRLAIGLAQAGGLIIPFQSRG
jgi:hypothetical protein